MSEDSVRRILAAIEQVAEGDYAARSGVVGEDGVGRIGEALDAMLARVQVLGELNVDLAARAAACEVRLERASRELESFSYSVSHDLKAPLRGVEGYAGILREDYADRLDDEGRRLLGNLVKCAQRMNWLIGDLLDYSRLERRELVPDDVDLQSHAERVLEGIDRLSQPGAGAVTVDMAGHCVLADRDALATVLRELVDNALKFSLPDRTPRVHISATRSGSSTVIEVRDHGIGFDMKHHDRMFGMFQQLNPAEQYPGTGAGLALVKRAVERMAGRVWAQSAPGEGACFRVELPAS